MAVRGMTAKRATINGRGVEVEVDHEMLERELEETGVGQQKRRKEIEVNRKTGKKETEAGRIIRLREIEVDRRKEYQEKEADQTMLKGEKGVDLMIGKVDAEVGQLRG